MHPHYLQRNVQTDKITTGHAKLVCLYAISVQLTSPHNLVKFFAILVTHHQNAVLLLAFRKLC